MKNIKQEGCICYKIFSQLLPQVFEKKNSLKISFKESVFNIYLDAIFWQAIHHERDHLCTWKSLCQKEKR